MISKVKPQVNDTGEKKEWFESWFDSPYYHILYQHRDDREAEQFLERLLHYLNLPAGARVLDIACGKGRHARFLHKKGFDVSGFDLSENSIQHNLQYEDERLHFFLHDMREVFRVNYFDAVFNLFSSFGYFEKDHDNLRCVSASASALKSGATYVLDYFNSEKIRTSGNNSSKKVLNGIEFQLDKKVSEHIVVKDIRFTDKGKSYHFQEKVRLFGEEDFERYFSSCGLKIKACFGNYQLEKFDSKSADRLIYIVQKP